MTARREHSVRIPAAAFYAAAVTLADAGASRVSLTARKGRQCVVTFVAEPDRARNIYAALSRLMRARAAGQ